MNCNVCYETYNKDVNPPLTCNPCGHGICEPCLNQWRRSSSSNRNKCPYCRQGITSTTLNRDLIALLENGVIHNGIMENNSTSSQLISEGDTSAFVQFMSVSNKKINEVIFDKSQYAVYILDNSGSMGHCDGKIVIENKDNDTFSITEGVSRWQELQSKTLQIAKYNMERHMVATYYLLNPIGRTWKEDIDYVTIDPINLNVLDKFNILKSILLDENNIRGNTPLDLITKQVRTSLNKFINSSDYKSTPICYNIITDGDPNNKVLFESELRVLANNYNIFLTINLCTDNDSTIDYYNDLDTKIGSEIGGIDVIDDIKGEQNEIINMGNDFFTYSHKVHICRMAGCNYAVADLLDEEKLSLHHTNTLVKNLLNLPKDSPHWTNREAYISKVKELNKSVYNLYYRKKTDLIDVKKLDWMIWKYQQYKKIKEFYDQNYIYIMVVLISVLFLFLFTMFD